LKVSGKFPRKQLPESIVRRGDPKDALVFVE
jgi:hypothetical protein